MAGGNLEVFKFGVYLFVPILTMFHFASPEWYNKHVLPVRTTAFLDWSP
jgi:protein PET100